MYGLENFCEGLWRYIFSIVVYNIWVLIIYICYYNIEVFLGNT